MSSRHRIIDTGGANDRSSPRRPAETAGIRGTHGRSAIIGDARLNGRVMALLTCAILGAWAGTIEPERSSRAEGPLPICGRVCDAHGPVAEARVAIKGRPLETRTDSEGRFVLAETLRPRSVAPSPATRNDSLACSGRRIVVAKEGYFVCGADTADSGAVMLAPLPQEDDAAYPWVDPASTTGDGCIQCHAEIHRQWAASDHGRSAANSRFWNMYEGTDRLGKKAGPSLLDEYPLAAETCFPCHLPALEPRLGRTARRADLEPIQRYGVHCDFCHKIADVDVSQPGHSFGRFATRLLRPPPGRQLFLGPLPDDDRGSSAWSPLYRQSRYCAACHEGVLLGNRFYSEYSEWLQSPAARRGVQCQDCHMAPESMTNAAPGHGGLDRAPGSLANHHPSLSKNERLRRCLTLRLEGSANKDLLLLSVHLALGDVGHRMPTGYAQRALILWVEAHDEEGRDVALLDGPSLPPLAGLGSIEQGGLAGRPGRMYTTYLIDAAGQNALSYWSVAAVEKDNRLRPGESDRLEFRFQRPQGDVKVVARLVYRRFPKDLADRKDWLDNDLPVAECVWESPPRHE